MKAGAVGPDPSIQSRVAELLEPGFYGTGVKRVKLIQTHTSWVFIAGGFAYKVKKPVNFGFLDYTTLSARRFFCQEEFRLNRLLSPELYVDVLPITDERGRLRFGGKGRVIDYCVKMRALPQAAIMTRRLERGEVSFEQVDEIARKVAQFHAQAERGPEIGRYGSSEIIRLNWDENFAQTMEFIGRTVSKPVFEEIKQTVEWFISENRERFRQRRQAGFVRRCHGDLHSHNIFLLDRVYIFDCIEFNPRFSCSDVASEIAFLAMDLDYYRRHDLASFFVERYYVYTGDDGALALLNFYQCYRAFVRAKVTSFQLNDPGISVRAKAAACRVARAYFNLAGRYARLLKAAPFLVVVFGLPGVGKSYLARHLAERSLAVHLLSDSIRKQLCGIPVSARRFDGYGKGIYTPEISTRTYEELFRRAEVFLRAGKSVVLDATFLDAGTRERCRQLAEKMKVKSVLVLVDCPERTVISRLRRRAAQTGFSDANLEIYRMMKQKFQPPEPAKDLLKLDSRQPVRRLVEKIVRRLGPVPV
ncbi:MAG: AAA family ATPase [candidate division WOR-3 bacterium]